MPTAGTLRDEYLGTPIRKRDGSMHTVYMVGGGLVLLLAFIGMGRMVGKGKRSVMARTALYFLPIWLIVAGINMWIGVTQAGYSVADEVLFFALVFGVPAAAAFALRALLNRK